MAVQLPPQQDLSPLPSPLSPRVLLVDVVGELGAWWGTAHIAFVGGSMGSRGGQNMIEPAAYGAAVSFGPNTWNFRDIVAAILARDAAVVVADQEQFTRFVRRSLEEPEFAAALGRQCAIVRPIPTRCDPADARARGNAGRGSFGEAVILSAAKNLRDAGDSSPRSE